MPASPGKKLYVEGIARTLLQRLAPSSTTEAADLAILRVASPSTTYPYGGAFAGGGRAARRPAPMPPLPTYGITLAYGNAGNFTVLENIRKVAATAPRPW